MDDRESNTPEQDMEIAESAMAHGDLEHAVSHIARALAAYPLRRDWLAVLERIIAIVPDPARLAPIEGHTSFAMVAVHGYILGRLGRIDQAIGLLLQVFAIRPDIPYLAWASEWLRQPGIAHDFDFAALNPGILSLLNRFPGTVVKAEEDRIALKHLIPLVGELRAVWDRLIPPSRPALERPLAFDPCDTARSAPQDAGVFGFFLASVLRKAGQFDEALQLSEEAYRRVPCHFTACARAMALSALGKVDEAVAAYREATRFEPNDDSELLEAAELLWKHERLDEAEHLYEEILQKHPEDPRAIPSYCYLRYLSSDFDASWLERIRDFVETHPDHPQGREILRRMTPYFGYLPSPADALVKILPKLAESLKGWPPQPRPWQLKYRVSGLEAPSAGLALTMLTKRYGQQIELDATIEAIPEPDPRRPLGRVWYQLWRYEETSPIPVLPPPPEDVVRKVAAIASRDYDLALWAASAARLGHSLRPIRVDELLGVMVHPPLAPDEFTPWDWVQRIQIAAALAVAALDEGWAGSLRRKVLISLINGPMDWSVSAAIVALAQLALTQTDVATEAHDVFRARLRSLPDRGFVCYAIPLVLAMLEVPGITGTERAELRARLRELL
jgi:tetratricopeptide (TPR) repeat protein